MRRVLCEILFITAKIHHVTIYTSKFFTLFACVCRVKSALRTTRLSRDSAQA